MSKKIKKQTVIREIRGLR